MAIREIVTLGFGATSPVYFIPTLGYGGATLSPPNIPGIETAAPRELLHYAADGNKVHYAASDSLLHYAAPED